MPTVVWNCVPSQTQGLWIANCGGDPCRVELLLRNPWNHIMLMIACNVTAVSEVVQRDAVKRLEQLEAARLGVVAEDHKQFV